MVKKIVGKKLKATRLKNDMTIQELALSSRVSSNMISRIERGLTIPSVEILMKLANTFGMSINYFVEDAATGSTIVKTKKGEGEPIFFFEDKHQINSLTHGLRDPGFAVFYDTLERDCSSGDGEMVHSTAVGESLASRVLTIGNDGGNLDRALNGTIDEVRMYNRSLSESEINQLYFSNLNKYDTDKWLLYINQSKNSNTIGSLYR